MNNLLDLSLRMKNLFKKSYNSEVRVCSANEKAKHSNEQAESLCLKDRGKAGKRKRESRIKDERILASSGDSEDEVSKKEEKKKKSQKDIKANLEPLDEEKSGLKETGKEKHKMKGTVKQTKKDNKLKEELLEELYVVSVDKKRRTLKNESEIPANGEKLKTEDGIGANDQGLGGEVPNNLKHAIPEFESRPAKSVGCDEAKVVPNNDAPSRKRKQMDAANENNGASEVQNTSVEPNIVPTEKTGKRNREEEIAYMMSQKQAFHDEYELHRTVFVRNLPLKTKKQHMIREFSQFGEMESARLRLVSLAEIKMPRKNAILKTTINEAIRSFYAYIIFKNEQSANAALSHNMSEFGGNYIHVDKAQPLSKKLRG
eukprot:TRINITY_DN2239_c0_g1_i1.p1 TRINITY_DN2239_c0_g1~~TRINITY_DN2239_c0_g1_i1.p1  ORF type:complete len:372 (-),score=76.77 TRINITY_DN2239_c0_g1_i1:54-1169(-)